MKEKGWAIVGNCGLYTGWWQTRVEAIQGHVTGYRGGHAARTQGLTDEDRRQWARRKSLGDRCVRVTISYR